jgi:hypothetical protein
MDVFQIPGLTFFRQRVRMFTVVLNGYNNH